MTEENKAIQELVEQAKGCGGMSHDDIDFLASKLERTIETLVYSLDYYRKVWLQPSDFAIVSLRKDRGRVASNAFDLLEIIND